MSAVTQRKSVSIAVEETRNEEMSLRALMLAALSQASLTTPSDTIS
jgi:hypothetical protein